MPVSPTYPGVYIQEIPSGVRTIVGVPTSVTAFVGYFPRGPLDTPVQVFNEGDFNRHFGGLQRYSEASYAVRQYFMNGGSVGWAVRAIRRTAGVLTSATASVRLQGALGDVLTASAGRQAGDVSVADPGSWGNALRIDIDYNTDPGHPDAANRFNLSVTEIDAELLVNRLTERVLRTEEFRDLTMRPDTPEYALDVVNESSLLVQLTRDSGAASLDRPSETGTVGAPTLAAFVAGDYDFNVTVTDVAAVAQTRSASFTLAAAANLQQLRSAVEGAIRRAGAATAATAEIPLLTGATVHAYGGRLRVLGGRTRRGYDPEDLITFTEDTGSTAADLGLLAATANVQQYRLGSPNAAAVGRRAMVVVGTDGTLPADLPGANDLLSDTVLKRGLHALEDVKNFNILCIPRAAEIADETEMQTVYQTAANYCEARRAFLLVDVPPATQTLTQALEWMDDNAGLRHNNAAAYYPRPSVPDPLNNFRLRSLGASGTMAGLYARTDNDRGVWKAPAGIEANLRNVPDLAYQLTDQENGQLNPLGLNCLRNFDIYGNVSWGARTLSGADALASEWKYVPVRRLALFIEESLYQGTQWVVFEPNSDPLWAQIRLNVGTFMHNLFRQGAFHGQTPGEAYLVKCDAETTTQADIDRGIVNILVGFRPLKPAEFVIISIQQLAGQAA